MIHIFKTLFTSRLLSESRFSALFGLVQFVFVRLLWQPERTLGDDLLWISIPSKGGGTEGGAIDILLRENLSASAGSRGRSFPETRIYKL